jgi:hypothetical protein
LPSIEPGLTLLETGGDVGPGPLQAVVIDHVLSSSGGVAWIDSCGQSRTTTLCQLAPSRRLLERINIARGFTAPQHLSLVQSLLNAVGRREAPEDTTPTPTAPSLVVVPAAVSQYRSPQVAGVAASEFRTTLLTMLRALAEDFDLPVLLTTAIQDSFAEPVRRAADRTVTCESTRFGPLFDGPGCETLVYPDGNWLQTTLSYWREVITERAQTVSASWEVGARG